MKIESLFSLCNPLSKEHSSYESFGKLPTGAKVSTLVVTGIAVAVGALFFVIPAVFIGTYAFRKMVSHLQKSENATILKTNELSKEALRTKEPFSTKKIEIKDNKREKKEKLTDENEYDIAGQKKTPTIQSNLTQQEDDKSDSNDKETATFQGPYNQKISSDNSLKQSEYPIFGKAEWEKFFGDVGKVPDLPKNYVDILESKCPFKKNKKIKETHVLVLIPETVNGKPLTLIEFAELVKNHKTKPINIDLGCAVKDRMKEQQEALEIKKKLESTNIDLIMNKTKEARWVLMVKDIPFESSMSRPTFASSYTLEEEFNKKEPFERDLQQEKKWSYGALRDITIAICSEYFRSGETLLKKNYTWTPDYVRGYYRVGKFDGKNLSIGLDEIEYKETGMTYTRVL